MKIQFPLIEQQQQQRSEFSLAESAERAAIMQFQNWLKTSARANNLLIITIIVVLSTRQVYLIGVRSAHLLNSDNGICYRKQIKLAEMRMLSELARSRDD